MIRKMRVKDLFKITEDLIKQGKGDYKISCNDEYDLIVDVDDIMIYDIDEDKKKIDFGGLYGFEDEEEKEERIKNKAEAEAERLSKEIIDTIEKEARKIKRWGIGPNEIYIMS